MRFTKTRNTLATKLPRIAELSKQDKTGTFIGLIQHINVESLWECYKEMDGKKAKGIDNVSKQEYGKNLPENLHNLIERMKTMSYRPQPVRRVLIPKENGKTRPLYPI